MDDYAVIEQLRSAVFSPDGFLVEHKGTMKRYVMKKLECRDESEANKILNEARGLLGLKHERLATVVEAFVTWDRYLSTFFVCFLRNWQKTLSLEQKIMEARSVVEEIPEEKIGVMMAQLIDVLAYLHERGIVHRSVKPSNIFITASDDLILTDPITLSRLADQMTCTRQRPAHQLPDGEQWHLPRDVLVRPTCFTIDSYSLGMILLELVTTHYSIEEFHHLRKSAKEDGDDFLHALQSLHPMYSWDLLSIVKSLLRRKKLPKTIDFMLTVPYVAELLRQIKSTRVRPAPLQQMDPQLVRCVEQTNTATEVLAFLRKHEMYENGIIAAIDRLDALECVLDGDQLAEFLLIMERTRENDVAQNRALASLYRQRLSATVAEYFDTISDHYLALLIRILQMQRVSTIPGVATLMRLLQSEDIAVVKKFLDLDAHITIYNAIKQFPESEVVVTTCCGVLWSMSKDRRLGRWLARRLAVERKEFALTVALKVQKSSVTAVGAILPALWVGCIEMAEEAPDLVFQILEAVQLHITDSTVAHFASSCFAAVCRTSELARMNFLAGSEEDSQILTIMNMYKHHADNGQVVKAVAACIAVLADQYECLREMRFYGLAAVLDQWHQRYRDNPSIAANTEKVKKLLTAMPSEAEIRRARDNPRSEYSSYASATGDLTGNFDATYGTTQLTAMTRDQDSTDDVIDVFHARYRTTTDNTSSPMSHLSLSPTKNHPAVSVDVAPNKTIEENSDSASLAEQRTTTELEPNPELQPASSAGFNADSEDKVIVASEET